MKYKLVRELPFLKEGSVFGTGSWVSGGYGVDLGTTTYKGGGTSHNGIKTFNESQNALLESIIDNKKWIEHVPESVADYLFLYDHKRLSSTDLQKTLQVREIK